MKKIVALFLLLPFYVALGQEEFKPIDSIFNLYKKQPGLSVMVTKNNQVIYQRQAGYADIESNEPITPQTIFYLASVSKQFTAACIVILEQRGKLDYEDRLSKYFPDFPVYAQKISINHLLSHTSGLKDIGSLAFLKGEDDIDYSNEKVRQVLAVQELNFEPGTAFSYSNSGYWCLVQIVEKVSGMPIAEFAEKNIFEPLKMTDTRYINKPGMVIKNRAKGYKSGRNGYSVCPVDGLLIAGAGVSATIGDLQRWLADMHGNEVLGKAFWAGMVEQGYIGDGFGYAKGLFIGKYGGKKQIEHGGDVDGFHNLVDYYPDAQIGLIILSNDDDVEVFKVKRAAVNRSLDFIYKYPGAKPIKPQAANLLESVLNNYAGRYENKMAGLAVSFYLKEQQLYMIQEWDGNEFPIQETDDVTFGFDDMSFRFASAQEGKSNMVTLMQGGEEMDLKRNDTVTLKNNYADFEGDFYSQALNATYTFFIENGVLRYKVNNSTARIIVLGDKKDNFVGPSYSIDFERDKKQDIKGFTLNHERVKNVKFLKKG